jgi:hypothetical protein
VRSLLASHDFVSVAAAGVVVSYTDEPADFRTFRLGLFRLDKLLNVDRTVDTLIAALDQIADVR